MQLIDRVWGSDYVGDTKTLDVHVKRLRAKIEPDPGDAAAPGDGARAGLQVRAAEPLRGTVPRAAGLVAVAQLTAEAAPSVGAAV